MQPTKINQFLKVVFLAVVPCAVSVLMAIGCGGAGGPPIPATPPEVFDFKFKIIRPLANGKFSFFMRTAGECVRSEKTLTKISELLTAYATRIAEYPNIYNWSEISDCDFEQSSYDVALLRSQLGELAKVTRTGGGLNPTGLDIRVNRIQLVVHAATVGDLVNGMMVLDSGDIPATKVNSGSGQFKPEILSGNEHSFHFNLSSLTSVPKMIHANFSFLAAHTESNRILVVVDGKLSLQY